MGTTHLGDAACQGVGWISARLRLLVSGPAFQLGRARHSAAVRSPGSHPIAAPLPTHSSQMLSW